MKPEVICHMMMPLDARVDTAGWGESIGLSRAERLEPYWEIYRRYEARGYIVGRITMEPYARGTARPATPDDRAVRPVHRAATGLPTLAVVVDASGRLHWEGGDLDGEHLVMVLGPEVPDSHLCELAERGLSYIVSPTAQVDPAWLIGALKRDFGAERIIVEGGGILNGHFLAAGVVDEISLVLVPAIDGTTGARTIFEGGPEGLGRHVRLLGLISVDQLTGGVLHLRYRVEATGYGGGADEA